MYLCVKKGALRISPPSRFFQAQGFLAREGGLGGDGEMIVCM